MLTVGSAFGEHAKTIKSFHNRWDIRQSIGHPQSQTDSLACSCETGLRPQTGNYMRLDGDAFGAKKTDQ
ncbi:MAG: hypothetical protein CBB71_03130 [Rhodopirellula sp. TMED11]|nr:MAG: hypothetical protein CBB71_17635 [Rhodopirellula sp. TMED11]OUT61981.1 MAG: hypothetical protein CBB71_03130 [Rhodopirellula sp. TMED11]